jgi:alpha/beta superfamily hydrolase
MAPSFFSGRTTNCIPAKGGTVSRSQKVSFTGTTGETLSGILDVPEGPVKGWGVFSHGFTLGKDSPAASRICKALADNGVGMLRFDNLGLGESAGSWSEGSFSHKVADTVRAAEFMRDEGKGISLLVGHSFGGAAVLAAAREIPELDAVATVAAPFSPKHVAHVFDAALDKILSEGSAEVDLGGKRVEIRRHFVEDLEKADLTDCIMKLHKPLMVLHSPTDNTVGIENASAIFQAARHPRSFVSLEGSDHLLTGKGQAARAAKIISAWADQYLDAGK